MRKKAALLSAVVLALSFAAVPQARGQYFGQNQVQYREFDFQVLKTQHFDIYYYPEMKESAEIMGRLAERWYSRLGRMFNHKFQDRQPLVLYASASDFRQTNVVPGVGEGTGGVTEGLKRRVVMPSAGALADTSHVLGHELVHAFQYDIAARRGSQRGGSGFERLPLWFVEGLAEYLSIGPVDSQTAMWLRDAVQANKLPSLKDLGNPRFFPYRFGHAFWAYVGGRWGDDVVVSLYREGGRSGDAVGAIKRVLAQDEKTFSKEWGDAIRRTYAGFLEAQKDPSFYGPLLVGKKRAGGELNLGPALSPDGKRIVFLSEKDLFSIDLFLADTQTGKVIRKLASTATDPHFDSLQFISSAGAWSADGQRFVQGALRDGKPTLLVIDPESGKRLEEIEVPEVAEIENPAFTPDGGSIVFTANKGGLLDLWQYDRQAKTVRRLTNDAFAELQPTVSPDGKTVAFTTDRFTSRLDTLEIGNYRIGVLDLASGEAREVPGYKGARNSNPQWSPDGKTIFFVSDIMGGSDVHRVDLATGELRQVTALRTGVYGITPLSPSLSVARESGRIAFTAREDGDHNIYAIDDPAKRAGVEIPADRLAQDVRNARVEAQLSTPDGQPRPQGGAPLGTAAEATSATSSEGASTEDQPKPGEPRSDRTTSKKDPFADTPKPPPPAAPIATADAINGATAVLPPYNRVPSRVEKILEDPNPGLPTASTPPPTTEEYKSKLSLAAIGQPSIGVGVDRWGSYVGGSTSLYFTDMLGNHNLAVSVQAMGDLQDIAGQAIYTNLKKRFDWGVGAAYIPYLFGGNYFSELTNVNGRPILIDSYQLYRQTDASVFAVGAYPFTRAQRFEVQATARRYGFSSELRTEAFDLASGEFLGREEEDIETGFDPLYMASVSAALVHDTSVFGATSPILGSRGRIEVSPAIGTVRYTDVLADWRSYFMPVRPITFAFRGMHFGRYGSGSQDPRFRSVYIGYPELIRGYDDIDFNECAPDPAFPQSQCPVFERLFGSRMIVANAEIRAPLWGLFTGRLSYGPLPIEIAAFADAGVAWAGECGAGPGGGAPGFVGLCGGESQKPRFLGGKQDWLTSVGAAVRANVFGFLVAEVSYARPFQRPGKGWVWQWSISPGF